MKCPVCNGQKHYKNVFGKDGTCQYCLGTGEVEEKKRTNFQRITASPEALAEFISSLPVNVPPCEIYIRCHKCIYDKQCEKGSYPTDNEIWLAWLKQESIEESIDE